MSPHPSLRLGRGAGLRIGSPPNEWELAAEKGQMLPFRGVLINGEKPRAAILDWCLYGRSCACFPYSTSIVSRGNHRHERQMPPNAVPAATVSPRHHTLAQLIESNRRFGGFGAPGRIRTSGPQIRSLVLYPAELRARSALRGAKAPLSASVRQKQGAAARPAGVRPRRPPLRSPARRSRRRSSRSASGEAGPRKRRFRSPARTRHRRRSARGPA